MHRTSTILHIALQICANCGIAFDPFIPFTAQKLRWMLGESQPCWDLLGTSGILPEAHPLCDAQLLFDKIDDDVVDAQINKLRAMKAKII
jgi:methionyl-tRNA synthetase